MSKLEEALDKILDKNLDIEKTPRHPTQLVNRYCLFLQKIGVIE
jgi:hypothetical protein